MGLFQQENRHYVFFTPGGKPSGEKEKSGKVLIFFRDLFVLHVYLSAWLNLQVITASFILMINALAGSPLGCDR